jgi:methylmalonyl-CoA mutase
MPLSFPAEKENSPFGHSSKKEWVEAAKQELGAGHPIEELIQKIDGIDLLPYYDQSDLPSTIDFQFPSSQNEFLEPRHWVNMPKIFVNDSSTANLQARQSLTSGADGILFELQGDSDATVLLKEIELSYCQTAFLADIGHKKFFHDFCGLVITNRIDPASVSGAIFWKEPSTIPVELMERFNGWTQFHAMGVAVENHASPSAEIAGLLAKAVKQIDNSVSRGVAIKEALHAVAFSVFIGTDFFMEIAKLKTLRILWLHVANAYEPGSSSSVFIHVTSKAWESTTYAPHANMLKGTVCSLSAILGGCDALTVEADDPHHPMMARVARNVSSILREESYLGKVADPTAGSYFLENLVDRLAQEAWKKFQALVKS